MQTRQLLFSDFVRVNLAIKWRALIAANDGDKTLRIKFCSAQYISLTQQLTTDTSLQLLLPTKELQSRTLKRIQKVTWTFLLIVLISSSFFSSIAFVSFRSACPEEFSSSSFVIWRLLSIAAFSN